MKLRFIKKQQEAADVWSFYFEPEEPVTWLAGQSIRLELPRPTWGYSERRFTIASAPYEKLIQITTRLSSSEFKQLLSQLNKGQIIDAHNIEGSFTWSSSDRPKLLLAGGIGITPYHSMLKQAIHDKMPLNATLIYSSREQPAVFEQELKQWSQQIPDLNIYITPRRFMIEPNSSLAPRWKDCQVYISGSAQMVLELRQSFIKIGQSEKNIKSDLFTGKIS